MKKIITGIILTLAFALPGIAMEQISKEINVNYPAESSVVHMVAGTQNLIISPKDDKTTLQLMTIKNDDGTTELIIYSSERELTSPSLASFGNVHMVRHVGQNPVRLMIHADVSHLEPFVSTESYFDIHNGGYFIAANNQDYKQTTFGFASNGAIKLNPQSAVGQQLQGLHPALGFLAKLAANHLPPSQVGNVHQFNVKPGCAISSITARPLGATKREASISGSIVYGDTFTMDLLVRGMTLELQPNIGHTFKIEAPVK